MAVGAAVVGAGMAAAGTAAAIRAQQMKTKPRGVLYGGGADALQGYRDQYADGVSGSAGAGGAAGGEALQYAADGSQALTSGGAGMVQRAQSGAYSPATINDYRAGLGYLKDYDPRAVVESQARTAMDQTAHANLGAGRLGGALGLRTAINANAHAGVQLAPQVAAAAAEAEQQHGLVLQGATMQQAQANAAIQQQNAQRQLLAEKTGYDTQLGGYGLGYQAHTQQQQLQQSREGMYLNAQQGVEQQQLDADLDYERRRQADQQRKSQNLWGLGSSLIGGGAKIMGGMSGGGG